MLRCREVGNPFGLPPERAVTIPWHGLTVRLREARVVLLSREQLEARVSRRNAPETQGAAAEAPTGEAEARKTGLDESLQADEGAEILW